ncbi:MAG: hypothetical protein KDI15_09485, partial [Thiothrix sp.]|nr:hypothetical protein [Thiothrix sp.]
NFIIRQVNEYLSLYGDFNENALALQLRIELDWQQHIERKIKKGWGSEWHYHTFDEIFEKIKNHQFLKNKSRIFACCDISGLDIDIRDLRGFSRAKYGFDLVIRDKDSGFYFKESSIKNAAFDFMLCLSFDAYVGLSRSTFSNLLCVTKSILSEKSFDHYVYDSGRSFVERRIDAGLEADPEKSTSLSFSIR